MPINQWQQRIRRAEHLANEHPFASAMLGFYIHTARFQQELHQGIERAGNDGQVSMSDPVLPEVARRFPQFLAMVEKQGPERISHLAHHLGASPDSWSSLLNSCWFGVNVPRTAPEDFLAVAYLQPYAELLRERAALKLEGYNHPLCPFCNRLAALGTLRQQGDGGRRSLVCGFCLCEWDFRRVLCSGCGEENQASLPVYTADQFPYIRVEACDSCHTYLKSIDLTKNGHAVPLVDELASIPLDLWAQEHEYEKLTPNLLGM